jgi:hypothetical protein
MVTPDEVFDFTEPAKQVIGHVVSTTLGAELPVYQNPDGTISAKLPSGKTHLFPNASQAAQMKYYTTSLPPVVDSMHAVHMQMNEFSVHLKKMSKKLLEELPESWHYEYN